jgi:hypothetical protein
MRGGSALLLIESSRTFQQEALPNAPRRACPPKSLEFGLVKPKEGADGGAKRCDERTPRQIWLEHWSCAGEGVWKGCGRVRNEAVGAAARADGCAALFDASALDSDSRPPSAPPRSPTRCARKKAEALSSAPKGESSAPPRFGLNTGFEGLQSLQDPGASPRRPRRRSGTSRGSPGRGGRWWP